VAFDDRPRKLDADAARFIGLRPEERSDATADRELCVRAATARSATTASDISIDLRRTGANAKLTITGGVGPFLGPQSDDPGGVSIELARTIIEGHRGRVEYHREAASTAVRLVVELPLRE
jgi:hypothetical protein